MLTKHSWNNLIISHIKMPRLGNWVIKKNSSLSVSLQTWSQIVIRNALQEIFTIVFYFINKDWKSGTYFEHIRNEQTYLFLRQFSKNCSSLSGQFGSLWRLTGQCWQVQVNVVSPPVLSPIVFPPGLRAGDRAQLTCTVTSGDMPVYFSWLKDKMPISSVLQVSNYLSFCTVETAYIYPGFGQTQLPNTIIK